MEILQRVELFAGTEQFDRRAGHRAHRQRGTPARIAIHPGHDNAGHAHLGLEGGCGVHRVLPGHGIDDEQGFVRVGGELDRRHLIHQRIIDRQTAGSVQHHHVEQLAPGHVHGARRNLHGRLAGDDRQRSDAHLARESGQLRLGGGAVHVQRGQQHFFLVAVFQPQRDLARGRGLARALQAHH